MTYHKIQSIFKRDENGKFTSEYSCQEFKLLKDIEWEWTEKIDGTNIRIMWDGKGIKIAGRTDKAQIPIFLYDKLNKIFNPLLEDFKKIFKVENKENLSVILYGEGFGNKIQKRGKNYIKDDVDFILFDIKVGDIWLRREDVIDIAQQLGLKTVKIIGKGNLDNAIKLVKQGFNSAFGNFIAEGLVLRPLNELKDRMGNRIITKIKYRDFKN